MASVGITWRMATDQVLDVQVECDEGRPDILDELCRRAVYLLHEAIVAVSEPETA